MDRALDNRLENCGAEDTLNTQHEEHDSPRGITRLAGICQCGGAAIHPEQSGARAQNRRPSIDIIGEGGGLRQVMENVDRVARTEVPVLVLGETGSGKELIAHAIHERSRRAAGPVLRVNCGAIPAELIDSELFGHEKGSFTGAAGVRRGWFERAHGGTLFLDEIGELPLAAQVRLLRVLQDGTFERVGGQRPITCDVRIVAATHRDLQAMVREGAFREDLWYRISVFPLRLPPLRSRMEDLPGLVRHFAREAGERLGTNFLQPSPRDLELLQQYSWPGNVRELAAVVERAAILGHGRRLDVEGALALASPVGVTAVHPVPSGVPQLTLLPSPAPAPVAHRATFGVGAGAVTLERAMVREIEAALSATRGVIEGPAGAAARLGINPHTLRSRMRKLRIEWSRFREAVGYGDHAEAYSRPRASTP
jgi:transcriptional regulator with GAF, ATPase, and Fis domain